jgi:LmbE family N-acetylglucosaminyl deacetylase
MKRSLIVGAHPDDIEVMMGYALAEAESPIAVLATNGEAGVNMTGTCLCSG